MVLTVRPAVKMRCGASVQSAMVRELLGASVKVTAASTTVRMDAKDMSSERRGTAMTNIDLTIKEAAAELNRVKHRERDNWEENYIADTIYVASRPEEGDWFHLAPADALIIAAWYQRREGSP